MKAFVKSIFKTIKSNLSRFFALLFIMLLGSLFVAGVANLGPHVYNSFDVYFKDENLHDLDIKSKSTQGFSSDAFAILDKDIEEKKVNSYEKVFQLDIDTFYKDSDEELVARFMAYDITNSNINRMTLVEGSKPSEITIDASNKDNVILTVPLLLEQHSKSIVDTPLGLVDITEYIDLKDLISNIYPDITQELIDEILTSLHMSIYADVVGEVSTPTNVSKDGEVLLTDIDKKLKSICYFDTDLLTHESFKVVMQTLYEVMRDRYPMLPEFNFANMDSSEIMSNLPTTDIYVDLVNGNNYSYCSKEYHKFVEQYKSNLSLNESFSDENVAILTIKENKGFNSLDTVVVKVNTIMYVFPVFFAAVVTLVCLTTLSRLIDEERSQIGCLKSLGYSDRKIVFKYVVFSLICSIVGGLVGSFTGFYFVPSLVYPTFINVFFIPKASYKLEFNFGFATMLIMIALIVGVTVYVTMKEVKQKPCDLLKHKAPKPGKKIILEKIPFIWNHLKFRQKSTCRNLLRYMGRFLMVVISVCGSAALVLTGFGLLNASMKPVILNNVEYDLSDSLVPVSVVLIIFALLLAALVIYNLTNMNIGERVREIATLEVLGYTMKEVYLYIFKEIFIMCIIGAVLGIPFGLGLLQIIFSMLRFGNLGVIKHYSYILTVVITLVFSLLVYFLLIPKIKKIDMNESLKSVE